MRRGREASPLSSIHMGSPAGKPQSFNLLLTRWLFQKRKDSSLQAALWEAYMAMGRGDQSFQNAVPSHQAGVRFELHVDETFPTCWEFIERNSSLSHSERRYWVVFVWELNGTYGFLLDSLKELTLFLSTWKCWIAISVPNPPCCQACPSAVTWGDNTDEILLQ